MKATKILNNVRVIQKCIIVRGDGKFLALQRAPDDHFNGGNWDLPGGGYEVGEQVEEAIKREVLEETGLTAKSLQPIWVTNRLNVTIGLFEGLNVFAVTYICRDWAGEVRLSEEHSDFRWVDKEEFLTFDFGDDSGYFAECIQYYNPAG